MQPVFKALDVAEPGALLSLKKYCGGYCDEFGVPFIAFGNSAHEVISQLYDIGAPVGEDTACVQFFELVPVKYLPGEFVKL